MADVQIPVGFGRKSRVDAPWYLFVRISSAMISRMKSAFSFNDMVFPRDFRLDVCIIRKKQGVSNQRSPLGSIPGPGSRVAFWGHLCKFKRPFHSLHRRRKSRCPSSPGKGKAHLRSFAVVVAVTFGIVLVAEFAVWLLTPRGATTILRRSQPTPGSIPMPSRAQTLCEMKDSLMSSCRSYDARWASYVYFRRKPFSGRHINVDSNGIRYTPEFSIRQIEPAVRLFLLGGSTDVGTGAQTAGQSPLSFPAASPLTPNAGRCMW